MPLSAGMLASCLAISIALSRPPYSSTRPLSLPCLPVQTRPWPIESIRLVFAAAFADLADEVVVSRFHELFKLRALGIAELFRLAKHAGVLAAQHVFVRNADPIIETLDDWLAADDANRAGDRRRFSHNLVRVAGDVVTARCRHVAHRNDDGLLGFRGFDRAPDDIGSQTRSAR